MFIQPRKERRTKLSTNCEEGPEKHSAAGSTVLTEADSLIHGQRMADYGPPRENLGDIAESWTPYVRRALELRGHLTATDVCLLMSILKSVRLVRGYHRDSVADLAGCAGLVEVLNETA